MRRKEPPLDRIFRAVANELREFWQDVGFGEKTAAATRDVQNQKEIRKHLEDLERHHREFYENVLPAQLKELADQHRTFTRRTDVFSQLINDTNLEQLQAKCFQGEKYRSLEQEMKTHNVFFTLEDQLLRVVEFDPQLHVVFQASITEKPPQYVRILTPIVRGYWEILHKAIVVEVNSLR